MFRGGYMDTCVLLYTTSNFGQLHVAQKNQ